VHGHGEPKVPRRERTKSAFELDIATESVKQGNHIAGEEESTALLSDADEPRDRDDAVNTAGAVRLKCEWYLCSCSRLVLAAARDGTCMWCTR